MNGKGPAVTAALIMFLLMSINMSFAETITLQQDRDGYSGCETRTIFGKGVRANEDQASLYLRGSQNRLKISFEIPDMIFSST